MHIGQSNRNICLFSVILILTLVTAIEVSGDTFFVSKEGNDNNSGKEDQPWSTIEKAAENLTGGDTVFIKEGTYSERVVPKNSGSEDNYIIYTAFAGDEVIIDGEEINLSRDSDGLFYIFDKSYIKISRLKIINAGPNNNNAGVYVENSNHITIENNHTINTVSSGIGVWVSDNIIIDGNEVELACNDGEQECITVATTDTFEISNNHVHNNGKGTIGGEGIDVKDGSSNGSIYNNHVHDLNSRNGIYIDAWDKHTFNIDVFQNLVHDLKSTDGIQIASECGGLLENVKIYNNIVYGCECNGIGLFDQGCIGRAHPMRDIKIVNNTIYNNGSNSCDGNTWGGAIIIDNPEAENSVVKNNICSQNLLYQIFVNARIPESNYVISNNLIDGFRDEADEETRGTDFVEGDPEFVDASNFDFHLLKDSPAIDAGSSLDAPDFDYDLVSRPKGEGVDIGAFEFTDSDNVTPTPGTTPTTSTPEPTLSPTPTQTSIPTPTPTPVSEKSFTFRCNREILIGTRGFEKLILKLNENESCILKLNTGDVNGHIEILTNIRTGLRSSIIVESANNFVDENGTIEFTITAIARGIDWVAWALPDEDGDYKFDKQAYDKGIAWGMFVEVK